MPCFKKNPSVTLPPTNPHARHPAVYNLFDDVMVLSEGRVVFHGVREQVAPFFTSIGFPIPERKSEPDFLQEVTSRKDQAQYWHAGEAGAPFMPVERMAEFFQQSPEGRARAAELAESAKTFGAPAVVVAGGDAKQQAGGVGSGKGGGVWAPDPLVRTSFALRAFQAFKVNTQRDWALMLSMKPLWGFKAFLVRVLLCQTKF